MGRVLKTTATGIISADELHSSRRIIEALKKSNQLPTSVWGDSE